MLPKSEYLLCVLYSLLNICASASNDEKEGSKYVNNEDLRKAKSLLREDQSGYGTKWIMIPDGNGEPQRAALTEELAKLLMPNEIEGKTFYESRPAEETVSFHLYNRKNPKIGVPIDPDKLDASTIADSKPIKIVIHGWRSNIQSKIFTSIRDAYLSTRDVNVIGVDWSEPASNFFYPAPAGYTQIVGAYVARLIDNLAEGKPKKYRNIHIIGHSLGSHTAGVAGHQTKRRVGRITGLDPALPFFDNVTSWENKLDRSDADFVDVIHTCSGILGLRSPIGHADFYPNGGSPFQPGCCCWNEIIQTCSHGRSHVYFAESILNGKAFPGAKCESWLEFKSNECANENVPMGDPTPPAARGTFYMQTESEAPYGLGEKGTHYEPY